MKVGIMGATGYTGCELIRILLRHPETEIDVLSAKIEKPEKVSAIFPEFKGRVNLECGDWGPEKMADCEVVFLALPHTISMQFAPQLLDMGKSVIDLSADYRIKSVSVYKRYYGVEHKNPELLKDAVYGLPEVYRDKIKRAHLIANPGCYPTSILLGVLPIMREGVVSEIIADSKTGATGAGRKASLAFNFAEMSESVKAYKVDVHQHIPEITQELGLLNQQRPSVTFIPHLTPMTRGILSTCYATAESDNILTGEKGAEELLRLYRDFYKGHPFVRIADSPPHSKHTWGSNMCLIHPTIAPDTGKLVIISCIDNLVKGAAGQAVQCMNLMLGLPEVTGLQAPAIFP